MNLQGMSTEELIALRQQAQPPQGGGDLSSMSNEELLALRRLQSSAGNAGGPDTVPQSGPPRLNEEPSGHVDAVNVDGSPMSNRQLASASGGGAAQLGYGLIEGAAAVPGMLGDVAGAMDAGIDWVASKFGARPRGERPRPLAPNTQEILEAIRPVTGDMPQPEGTAGQYLRTIGQFGAGAAIPGSVARRAIGGVLAPAVASETAGQAAREIAPDYETAARIAGGIGGGIAGGMRAPAIGANAQADARLAKLVTPNSQARLAELGPDAFLLEANPSLVQAAQGVTQRPGQAGERMRTAITDRHTATPQRLGDDVRATLGPPIDPARVDARIGRAQAQLGPDYRAALDHAAPVNSAAILNVIDQDIGRLAGNPQRALQEIRGFFFAGNRLKNSAGELLSIRQAIDDLVPRYEGQANATRVISEARQAVDDAIRQASPDIKSVDARFENLARQREALQTGGTILRTGPEALRPSELRRQLAGMTPNQRAALRIGARAEIDRVLGNSVYDVTAIRRLIKTQGKWAHEKLSLAFDPDSADELIRLVDREASFKQAYNDLIANSQTAPRLLAEQATRVGGPGNLAPEAVGAMAGMAVSGGNPLAAAPGMAAGSLVRQAMQGIAAGGQRRLDAALIDRLATQGPARDEALNRLLAAQRAQGQGGSLAARALLGMQGASVLERAR